MKKVKNNKNKLSGGIRFLLIVFGVYLVFAIFDRELVLQALEGFQQMFFRVAKILIFVFFAMVVANLYFTPKRVKKYLGYGSGMRGWLYAIISGVLVSGPPYVLFPLLGNLKKHGMKNSLVAVFLYNRNVKIPFLPVMIFYFGIAFTVTISILIILFSIINGLLIGWWMEKTKKI